MSTTKKNVKPFGIRDKVGYMFGDFGNDLTFVLSSMMLLKFYTDIMGVSAAIVGMMMMGARFVDAVTDITMGQIVDRSRPTAKGKFAPWLKRMCGPVAVASVLLYATWFQDMPMAFKVFWMFFSYLLWGSVCYTGINIPYGSMASAISEKPEDRTSLSNWRTIGATLGNIAIGVILPLFVYYTDSEGKQWLSGTRMSIAAVICSVLAVICYLLCYNLVTERVKIEQKTEKFSVMFLVNSLIQNKALIGIAVTSLFLILAQISLGNMGAYLYPNYFRNIAILSVISLIGHMITLAMSPFIETFAKKIGKKEIAIVASVLGAVPMLVAFVLHTKNVIVWMVCYCITWVGVSMFILICWAMITDVIDDIEVKTGSRSDGTVYSIYSFCRKLGQALSSGLTGVLLSMVGYSTATAFDTPVVNGIYNITCLVPGIAFVLMFLSLVFLYPLNKKKVEENAKKLLEKR